MAGFVLLAAGSQRRTSISTTTTVTTSTPATVTPTASAKPDPEDEPDPTTDYKTIDDAKLDGKKSYGKTLLLKVWRGSTDASSVTLFVCGKVGGFLSVKYPVEQRALVKAIPSTIPMQGHCPRVVLKITGKEAYTDDLKGDLQKVMDVTPKEAETLPPGVDYVSMDDINIDGKKAAGKIAQLKMYRGSTEESKFTGYPCGSAGGGGLNFVYVNFTADQKDMVKDISSSALTCEPVKIKLTTQQAYTSTWNSQLVGVTKE
ncbi:MAG TPA: hypothetical protein VGH28_15505 [Polyangiaceae bacterium]|jgi:predicted aconitase with swiveling domain